MKSHMMRLTAFAFGTTLVITACTKRIPYEDNDDATGFDSEIVYNDPEIERLRQELAPFEALLQDSVDDPDAVREAEAQLEARLKDDDATTLLETFRLVNDVMNGSASAQDFRLSAAAEELLQRHADIPYIAELARTSRGAPGSVRPQSIGQQRAALVRIPFTPVCDVACTNQVLTYTAGSLAGELSLKAVLKELAGGFPGGDKVLKIITECLPTPGRGARCTPEELKAVSREAFIAVGIGALAPQLAILLKIYSYAKLIYGLAEYHVQNVDKCEAYQGSPACDYDEPAAEPTDCCRGANNDYACKTSCDICETSVGDSCCKSPDPEEYYCSNGLQCGIVLFQYAYLGEVFESNVCDSSCGGVNELCCRSGPRCQDGLACDAALGGSWGADAHCGPPP